jgi:hypothetical protein
VRTAAIGLVNLIVKAADSHRSHLTHIRRIFMGAFRAAKRRTQRRQRCKKPRPLTNTRYWIHPRFDVGVYVEDPHAQPVKILISRHTAGALSVATSSNSVHVTAVDQQTGTASLNFITPQESQMLRQCQMKIGNKSLGQILDRPALSAPTFSMSFGIGGPFQRERIITPLLPASAPIVTTPIARNRAKTVRFGG